MRLLEAHAPRVRSSAHEAAAFVTRNAARVIVLHRANGAPIVVNADLIETVERSQDGETVVALTTGNVLVVTESPETIKDAAVAFRRSIGLPSI